MPYLESVSDSMTVWPLKLNAEFFLEIKSAVSGKSAAPIWRAVCLKTARYSFLELPSGVDFSLTLHLSFKKSRVWDESSSPRHISQVLIFVKSTRPSRVGPRASLTLIASH